MITDPVIPVVVRTLSGDAERDLLLDSGADFSAAPRRLGEEVGLDWESLPTARITGVGLAAMDARMGSLPPRIGDVELSVRCIFVDRPSAPLLLGRADIFDRFVITFDAGRQAITLTELP